jgi:hypothetical protein
LTWAGFSNQFVARNVAAGHKLYYTLEEQVQFFIQWLDDLVNDRLRQLTHVHQNGRQDSTIQRVRRPQFILLGHSIGAWLCVQVNGQPFG